MDLDRAAAMFKALGDPTRLAIFEFLRECSDTVAVDERGEVSRVCGPTAGQVCCHITGIERVTSTISFHLKELRSAGLIAVERQGQRMICSVEPNAVAELRDFLGRACCEKAGSSPRSEEAQ